MRFEEKDFEKEIFGEPNDLGFETDELEIDNIHEEDKKPKKDNSCVVINIITKCRNHNHLEENKRFCKIHKNKKKDYCVVVNIITECKD